MRRTTRHATTLSGVLGLFVAAGFVATGSASADARGGALGGPIQGVRSLRAHPSHLPKEPVVAAKFEVYEDKSGDYRFRLKAGNGEVVASGQGYASKAGAHAGCEAVKRAAADAEIVDV